MAFTKSYVFPILFGCWLPVTCFITYMVSVLTNHVPPVLPYISDTGSWAPESCIFGIMVTLGALIMFFIIYVRYRQIEDLKERKEYSVTLRRLNQLSLYCGICSVFGCFIVANFQVRLIFIVHIIGAVVCFGFVVLFQAIQVVISFKMYPIIGNKTVNNCRILFTIISATSFSVAGVAGIVAFSLFKGKDMTKWKPDDGGYACHVASAIGEYVLALGTVLNIVTFVQEFKQIEINQPTIYQKIREQEW